jgi:hypothetical protein
MLTPSQLHDAFAYQFAWLDEHPDLYERYRGWWPIFVRLCRQVDELLGADKRGFVWRQVKEKFGSGRFYWRLGDGDTVVHADLQFPDRLVHVELPPTSDLGESIRTLVHEAERDTKASCIVCGNPGELDQSHGWMLTLCPKHRDMRAAGHELPSFDDDKDLN